MHSIYLIIFLGLMNLDIITSTPPFECLHCLFDRFHSFLSKLCMMIVHTLKMCTDYAGWPRAGYTNIFLEDVEYRGHFKFYGDIEL